MVAVSMQSPLQQDTFLHEQASGLNIKLKLLFNKLSTQTFGVKGACLPFFDWAGKPNLRWPTAQ